MTQIERPNSKLSNELEMLVNRSHATTAILITKQGTGICEAGDCSYLNTTALAALIAGMFSATREVARIVGEEQFSILLQQGQNRHIHISLLTSSVMMVVIFDDDKAIGRVRHEANKATGRIVALLTESTQRVSTEDELSVPEFKEFALNLIDQIFVGKQGS